MVFLYALITCVISGLYVALIIYIIDQWGKLKDYSQPQEALLDEGALPVLSISIVIPARNEETHILSCLNTVLDAIAFASEVEENNFKSEIIVVDDHSQDATAQLVSKLNHPQIKLIKLADQNLNDSINAYKKIALHTAILQAHGDYIVQLDADVEVPLHYIKTITAAIHHTQADLIAGPVLFDSASNQSNRLDSFQTLDMMGMMALTAAGIETQNWYMANGANLIYKRQLAPPLASELTPHGESSLASGDDIFTIQSIATNTAHKILFLKSPGAIVTTPTEPNLSSLYTQRIRWATKNKYMKSVRMQSMMLIPFVHALTLFVHLILIWFVSPLAIMLFLFQLMTKLAVDYVYLKELAAFFKQEKKLRHFGSSAIGHVLYILTIGLLSLVVREYKWKGRRVS